MVPSSIPQTVEAPLFSSWTKACRANGPWRRASKRLARTGREMVLVLYQDWQSSPPHSPADSWKTVERGTLKVTERLCDDRDSIAHRRREAQDPSPRTRLDSQLTLPPQTLRRHACVYKRGWPPTCPATQPTQPTTLLLAPHKRSNQAQLPKAHPPPRAPLAARRSCCGEPARPGRRDAGGIFADGHPPHGPITDGALSLARLGGASNQYAAS